MTRRVVNSEATPPEPAVSPPELSISLPTFSPCERLWARYHNGPERQKVEILEELIQHGCLERARKNTDGPEVPVS